MPDAHKNFAVSSVATAPSPATSGTSLAVSSGEGARFPAVPFNAVVCPPAVLPTPANAEVVRVTARTTDTLTITRAQEGSSARTIVAGDLIFAAVTAKTLTDAESNWSQGTLAARPTAAAAGAGARYFATDDWGGSEYISTGTAWVLVSSKNQQVLDLSGASTGTFTGLDAGTDKIYMLHFALTTSGAAHLAWRSNGNSDANYHARGMIEVGGSAPSGVSAASAGQALFAYSSSSGGARLVGSVTFNPPTGNNVLASSEWAEIGSVESNGTAMSRYNNNTANMTSLVILPYSGGVTLSGRAVLRRAIP